MVLGKYMFTLNFCGFREKENDTAQLMSVSVETDSTRKNANQARTNQNPWSYIKTTTPHSNI